MPFYSGVRQLSLTSSVPPLEGVGVVEDLLPLVLGARQRRLVLADDAVLGRARGVNKVHVRVRGHSTVVVTATVGFLQQHRIEGKYLVLN